MAAAIQTNAVQTKAVEVKKAPEAPVKTSSAAPVKAVTEAPVKAPETAAKAAAPAKAAEAPAKTEAAVKAPSKTEAPAKAEAEKSVVVEFGGRQVVAKDVLAQAEKAYAETHPETVIKTIELYISPEQNAAYYVVNGEGSDDFKIEL